MPTAPAKPPHIALDARTIFARRPRGTGRNLRDAYQQIPALRPDWRFTLYHRAPLDVRSDTWASNVTTQLIDMPGDRWDNWFQWRLPWAAWADGVDLLHCPANAAPWYCPIPIAATIHDLVPLRVPEDGAGAVRERFARNVARAVRRASVIITPSRATRDELVAEFGASPDRIAVIPWAPDEGVVAELTATRQNTHALAAVRTKYELKEQWLLNFSGASRRKNAAGVIAALAELPPELRMHVQAVLVGCEPASVRDELRTYAERLGVGSSVRLVGFVPHDDLPALLCGAAGLLLPSLCEGFGLPILDAFAADTPVLTSNLSSMPEVAGDAAVFCNPHDPTSIATGIVALLDPQRAAALRLAGRERLTHFSWSRTAIAMVAAYEQALGGARRTVMDDSRELAAAMRG